METSQNIIESELRSSSGEGGNAPTPAEEPTEANHHHHHHENATSQPPPVEFSIKEEEPPENGSSHQFHHHHPHPMDSDHQGSGTPELCASLPMDHLNEESTGSGVTSLGDSNESSSHQMEDSLGTGMGEISSEKLSEDVPNHDDDDEEDDEAANTTPTKTSSTPPIAAKKAKEATTATKRFKCSHCSKSYVREFQLNTHVRKYHPEKPAKAQDEGESTTTTTTSTTTSPTKASNAWTQADMDEALESLKTERMTLVKASQHYGIPASTLWQRATKIGIVIPKSVNRTSSKDGVADAVQLLKTGQISVNKASKVFGIPPSTLYKIAKREGIQLSSPFNSATTTWTQENLQLAMDAIRTGQMSVHMASVEFKIPPGTLYGRCKREGLELSRNNPVQWSPRDLKNALEAVKTGQMSINQASEHYKISYSSLYKRVKPHFVQSNNNNNSSNSNHNLSNMADELGETDPSQLGSGVIVPAIGLDAVSMHHPMDYESHRPQMNAQPQHNPQVHQQPPGVVNHQLQYNSAQQQQQQQHLQSAHSHHQQQNHYGQPLVQHLHQHHPQQPQTPAMLHYPAGAGQAHQQSLPPVMRQQQHHLPSGIIMEEQQSQSLHLQLHHPQMHGGSNGHLQDERLTGGYPSHDVDKHGLTSSSGIGLNGLMGISMGFLDFAPELPAPVAVPVTEQYGLSSSQSPYSSVITKDNSGGARHNNGHYNGASGSVVGQHQQQQPHHHHQQQHHPSLQSNANSTTNHNNHNNSNNNNGYATLQNNYYHHSVIHSPPPVHQQQQQPQHPYGQQHHLQMHHPHLHSHPHQNQHHSQQRHGMVPLNEDKLLMQKDGGDPHAATAEFEEKVIVTTINDL